MTLEQMKILAEAERQMDAGAVPFVVCQGSRMIVDPLVMEEFGLQAGQTISPVMVVKILEAHLAMCQAELRLRTGD